MSVSDQELKNCIRNTFWELEYDRERQKEKEEFLRKEAEKVGAELDFKLIRDMSETEYMVKTALMEQGEEVNEIF